MTQLGGANSPLAMAEEFDDEDVVSDDEEEDQEERDAPSMAPAAAVKDAPTRFDAALEEAGATSDGSLLLLEVGDLHGGTIFGMFDSLRLCVTCRRTSCCLKSAWIIAENLASIGSLRG